LSGKGQCKLKLSGNENECKPPVPGEWTNTAGGYPANCFDGTQNNGETGVDCGGGSSGCSACPTCADGVKNGDESAVDCGGSCTACPTCSDAAMNGDETGTDCGGSCALCKSLDHTYGAWGACSNTCGAGTHTVRQCMLNR
jgi:hypothetical protein